VTEYIINQTLQKDFHNKADWNNCLKQFNESNIFQSYEWGELKESEGWMPLRVTVSDNESLEIILIGQILIKKVFGVSIAWCPGGPLIRSKPKENILAALDKFRESIAEYDIANLRCKTFMQDNDINREFFDIFTKPKHVITSRKTSVIEIQSEDEFLKQVKKKHRYYIKQSEKSNIDWKAEEGKQADKIFTKIYKDMQKAKHLNLPIVDITLFSKFLGTNDDGVPKVFAFSGFENKEVISSCLISIFDNKAFYHYAASTERGREVSASYGMIFNLYKYLKKQNVTQLDFGGLSEDGSSAGVDFFKEGFNGTTVNRIGEFDIAKSKIHNYLFNKAIKFKNKK